MTEVVTKLYADGGIPRFYRGLAPGLIQAPVSLGCLCLHKKWRAAGGVVVKGSCQERRCVDGPPSCYGPLGDSGHKTKESIWGRAAFGKPPKAAGTSISGFPTSHCPVLRPWSGVLI